MQQSTIQHSNIQTSKHSNILTLFFDTQAAFISEAYFDGPSVSANGGIRGIRGYYPTTDTTETGIAGHGVVYE
jgi:hypothetical protein